MAFVREKDTKACLVCGSALEKANMTSICNACKDNFKNA